jgi:hypothetical protein
MKNIQPMNYDEKSTNQKPGRRCCGLPLWGFVFLIIILVLLVAAAVVIPITLIVIPNNNANAAAAQAAANLLHCPALSPCFNGGQSVVSNNTCSCICVNGFGGSSCAKTSDGSCASSFNAGDVSNATAGSSIPRILTAAQSNFSIPLNTTAILALFSFNNLSCSDENALIKFDGVSLRKRSLPLLSVRIANPHPSLVAREPQAQSSIPAVTLSNGLVFASTQGAAPTAPATATATATGSPTASATATPTASGPSQTDFDFARAAVLYILETSDLGTAVAAQGQLQNALGAAPAAALGVVDVGRGAKVDFLRGLVTLGNGTVVGGVVGSKNPGNA